VARVGDCPIVPLTLDRTARIVLCSSLKSFIEYLYVCYIFLFVFFFFLRSGLTIVLVCVPVFFNYGHGGVFVFGICSNCNGMRFSF
jgi:hypothetical protein